MTPYKRLVKEVNEAVQLVKGVDGRSIISPFSDYDRIMKIKYHLIHELKLDKEQVRMLKKIRLKYDRRAKGFL